MPREAGGQEVRLRAGIGRLGRGGPGARRQSGAVRRERGESLEEKDKGGEGASGRVPPGCQVLPHRMPLRF